MRTRPVKQCPSSLLSSISAALIVLVSLTLYGCSANFIKTSSRAETTEKAHHYLKLSQESSSSQSLAYRLQAADHFIQANNMSEAQRILRGTQLNTPHTEPTLRRAILEARLALLKKDFSRARNFLKAALTKLELPPDPSQPIAAPNMQNGLRIALLLPSKGPHADAAKTVRDGFLAGYYKTKQQQPTNASIKIYDTGEGNKVREAYEKALAEQAQVIVGPLTKPEVQSLAKIQHLALPVLALNTVAEDSSLPRQLYQFGLMPEDEVVAIAEHALRHRNHRALVFAPQTEWGQRLVSTFKHYWQSHGGTVVEVKFFNPKQSLASNIQGLLQVKEKQRRQDADMIFLAASPEMARQIKPLLNLYHAETLPVYATSAIYTGTPSPGNDHDLNGIRFCDMPWVLQHSAHLQDTYQMTAKLWPGSSNRSPRFFAMGMDAYQLAHQLVSTHSFPTHGFSGVTGALRLNAYRRIQRELVCAKFEQGVAVPD
jgi:outer membrane PBP1 activator LpoA protein